MKANEITMQMLKKTQFFVHMEMAKHGGKEYFQGTLIHIIYILVTIKMGTTRLKITMEMS